MSQIKEKDASVVKNKLFLIQSSVILLEEKYANYFTKDDHEILHNIKNAVKIIDDEYNH